MNKNQIKLSLSEYGYTTNTETDLAKITMIFMDHDVRLYTDKNLKKFMFDDTNEVLNIYSRYDKDMFKLSGQVPYEAIAGFIQTSKIMYNGQIAYK